MQIIWSRDRSRSLLFENCNQRATQVSLHLKIDPTKYLKWFEALKFAGAIGVHWLVPVLLLLERS